MKQADNEREQFLQDELNRLRDKKIASDVNRSSAPGLKEHKELLQSTNTLQQ